MHLGNEIGRGQEPASLPNATHSFAYSCCVHFSSASQVTRPSKQQAAPAVTYTMTPTFTTEQEEFNAALGGFLGVPGPVKLPLMAPGAAVLDLKALLLKVVELGGAKQVDSQRKWRDVARALRQGTEHAGAVREVRAFGLLRCLHVCACSRTPLAVLYVLCYVLL